MKRTATKENGDDGTDAEAPRQNRGLDSASRAELLRWVMTNRRRLELCRLPIVTSEKR